jgi:hypothetical protein
MIFLNGNTDVITRILEFVAETSEDLNTCAMISRSFRLSRSDPRLDQTRTGTIIFKTSVENIPPEVWQRWDQQTFTGNRVRLVAILPQLPVREGGFYDRSDSDELPFALTSVREIILQREDSSAEVPEESLVVESSCEEHGGVVAIRFFKKIIPNLDILDIGALTVTNIDSGALYLNSPGCALYELRASVFRCIVAEAVLYPGACHFRLIQQPYPLAVDNHTKRLCEIHVDPFRVVLNALSPPITAYCNEYSQLEQERWFDDLSYYNNGADWVLLQEFPNLTRVTLKNAYYRGCCDRTFGGDDDIDYWKKLPQEVLIKFVRYTPELRWFCSDLTQENIAVLKDERPEVEFCNYPPLRMG